MVLIFRHCLKMPPLWPVLLYLLQFLWVITYSLIYFSTAEWQWNAQESSDAQWKWQCCNGCIILTQWNSSNFMTNKFRLRMFEQEMESKSDVVRTKSGERLNLIKFQIAFSFCVSPSFLLFEWMQKGEMVLVWFFVGSFFFLYNLLPTQPPLGELF